MKPIFASQGLRSTPLLSTLGRLSQKFVIPVYRPLADFWSSVHVHYIIINQWEWLYYYLFEGVVPKTSVNWANTLKVSVNIVLLCLGGQRFMTKSTVFSTCRHCLHFSFSTCDRCVIFCETHFDWTQPPTSASNRKQYREDLKFRLNLPVYLGFDQKLRTNPNLIN